MKNVICAISLTAVLVLTAGCASLGKGPTDEELIQQTLDQWSAGLVEKDVDKLAATISENFSAQEADTKEELIEFIRQGIDAGYFEDAEVSREDAEYTMEEGKCDVYPVDLSSSMGSVSVGIILSKEDSKWLVTGLEVDGM